MNHLNIHRRAYSWAIFLLILLLYSPTLLAQNAPETDSLSVPKDTLNEVLLPTIYVKGYKHSKPLSLEERKAYWRRIRDVKKVLPYAKYITHTLVETYEYAQTLPTEKEQDAHLERVTKELKKEMEPKMRDLTLNQGRLLIKLINRQSGSSSYELVSAILGGFKAWWWNTFASMMGASLKSNFDPKTVEDDAVTERIIQLYEAGML